MPGWSALAPLGLFDAQRLLETTDTAERLGLLIETVPGADRRTCSSCCSPSPAGLAQP